MEVKYESVGVYQILITTTPSLWQGGHAARGECGDEERLALEHGGRVIIFPQEFPHLKSSLGSPLLYVCSRLLRHIAAASGSWLHGTISSASVCVCVHGCVYS